MGQIAPTRFLKQSSPLHIILKKQALIDISPPLLKRFLSCPILDLISFFLSHNYLTTTQTKCYFTNNKDYVNYYALVIIINTIGCKQQNLQVAMSSRIKGDVLQRVGSQQVWERTLYNVGCFTTSLTLCSCTTWKRVVSASWNSLSGSLEAAGSRSAKKNLRPAPNAQLNNFHFPQILNVKTFTSNWKARVFLITRAWIWRPFLDFMNETITSRLCCDLTGALQRRLSFSYIR